MIKADILVFMLFYAVDFPKKDTIALAGGLSWNR